MLTTIIILNFIDLIDALDKNTFIDLIQTTPIQYYNVCH